MKSYKLITFIICIHLYCSIIARAVINEPTNIINLKNTEVTVVFEEYFENDSASLWINNKLIFSKRTETDLSSGAADFVYFKQPKSKTFLLAVEVNGCKLQKELSKKDKFVYINYESSKCEITIETSDKLRSYF